MGSGDIDSPKAVKPLSLYLNSNFAGFCLGSRVFGVTCT